MDEMIDKEISLIERRCDRLRKDIERFSTPRDRLAQARDSGIAKINDANGDQYYDPGNTVVFQLMVLMNAQAMLQCAGRRHTMKVILMGLCLRTHWLTTLRL